MERERPMFKLMLKGMISMTIFLYRLTGGAIGGRMKTMGFLLLTTIGRKSGRPRTVPLAFLRDGSAYVIIASNAGFPQNPAWFLNLKSHPEETIQVKRQHIRVKAETANPEKRQELWAHLMEVAPGYGRYQKRTTREIPLVILYSLDGSGEERSA
jgi:deazaflavin-dependent oxidoreductase (nitroreductase family)